MTKQEMKEGIRILLSACSYLEKTYGDQREDGRLGIDMRPWVSGDHPLSVAHWIMCQKRFGLTWTLRGTPDDPQAQEKKKRRFTSA